MVGQGQGLCSRVGVQQWGQTEHAGLAAGSGLRLCFVAPCSPPQNSSRSIMLHNGTLKLSQELSKDGGCRDVDISQLFQFLESQLAQPPNAMPRSTPLHHALASILPALCCSFESTIVRNNITPRFSKGPPSHTSTAAFFLIYFLFD